MIYKNTAVHFDVNAQVKRSVSANIQFSTQDIGTAKLSFNLTKDGVPLPISKATHAKLFMKFTDGSQVYVNTEVEDALKGAIFYVLTPEQVKHYGTVQAELYVNYDNGQKMSVHKFSFVIDRALVDQGIAPIAEYYIEDFETLKAVIQEMADDAEQLLAKLEKKFETLNNIETKDGAQQKADAAQKNAEDYTDQHAAKTDNPHKVTKSQVGLDKVDNVKQATKAEFDTHNRDDIRHITADERTKWNAGQLYKLTDDNGGRTLISDDTDLLTLPSGLYYGVSNKVVNSPEPKAVEWFHYDVSTNNARKTIVVTATANPRRWFGTIHTDGSFKGWQRFITDADAEVTWQSPTLLNGWKQYGTHKVQFSKNALGEVEIIGSITGGTIGFDVPAFTLPAGYRPIQMLHFIGVASSQGTGTTPQYHRTQIATDGTVYIQSCSNTVNPNEFITFGFKFKAA
ncbi:phage baseplate upper protein [Bacillus sp. FSL K6-5915]|uniref:Phage baseplate upper protein n=4 Tax=Bacillus licheniformis TaxID=1402 RepID=A0AB37GLU2_BACLI|nr:MULTISPECIES: phage baseplate upper protein [Bacillus subtilis group]AVI47071.1 Phage-like element PBSX protein XkdV [Bacillus licheniformis]PAE72392.1 phage tail protein [Bacillus licheniformis]QBR21635.1 phage baseplate upper protein [Bacillus licheniformis]QPR74048.1 phage baseplate upper protein [Bacillus licheniformis]